MIVRAFTVEYKHHADQSYRQNTYNDLLCLDPVLVDICGQDQPEEKCVISSCYLPIHEGQIQFINTNSKAKKNHGYIKIYRLTFYSRGKRRYNVKNKITKH